jgi:class 3 adenylate cyclase
MMLGVGVPSGTVTFLFTDIEGSTRLWETASTLMGVALERHDTIVRGAIEEAGGYVFATGGDGFAAAFTRAGDGLAAALRAEEVLEAEAWPEDAPIKVRMAVHTGEVSERHGDYFGTPVNQVARLMALAHGGQILCSAVTAGLVTGEVPLLDLGEHRLRDLSAAQRVFQVGERRFPALRSVDAVPGNLPTMLTELVGRSDDIAGLVKLLEHDRLVTLTGVGGVGKTRLALAVAAATTAGFPDGCWLAELAPAGSAAEVIGAVTSALGVAATNVIAHSLGAEPKNPSAPPPLPAYSPSTPSRSDGSSARGRSRCAGTPHLSRSPNPACFKVAGCSVLGLSFWRAGLGCVIGQDLAPSRVGEGIVGDR